MSDKWVGFLMSLVMIVSFTMGYGLGRNKMDVLLYNCEKLNNVFECELVAVPKGETK